EAAVVNVVLASPHYLYRTARILRQKHGIDDEVGIARSASAEATAHQQVIELDLLASNSQRLRAGLLCRGLALRAAPNLGRVTRRRHCSRRVQRLHLCMISVVQRYSASNVVAAVAAALRGSPDFDHSAASAFGSRAAAAKS